MLDTQAEAQLPPVHNLSRHRYFAQFGGSTCAQLGAHLGSRTPQSTTPKTQLFRNAFGLAVNALRVAPIIIDIDIGKIDIKIRRY